MTFIHNNPYKIDKLKRVTENGKRYYLTPTGEKYPSVTTVSSIFAKKGYEELVFDWNTNFFIDIKAIDTTTVTEK